MDHISLMFSILLRHIFYKVSQAIYWLVICITYTIKPMFYLLTIRLVSTNVLYSQLKCLYSMLLCSLTIASGALLHTCEDALYDRFTIRLHAQD